MALIRVTIVVCMQNMENYPGLLFTPMGADYVVIDFDMEVQPLSYPRCSLTFLHERYLRRCCEQSFAIHAYAMSIDIGTDVVSVHKLFAYMVVSTISTDIMSSHTKYCRIAYGITR